MGSVGKYKTVFRSACGYL